MTDFKSAVVALGLLLAFSSSGSSQPALEDDLVAGQAAQAPQAPDAEKDNDPTVYPDEVVAPAVDWDDEDAWGGSPPPWFEDLASVDCHGREACEEALQNLWAGGEA